MTTMPEEARKVIKEVIEAFEKTSSMFVGVYDKVNGSDEFMYGIMTVMCSLAYSVSEEYGEDFSRKFIENMS